MLPFVVPVHGILALSTSIHFLLGLYDTSTDDGASANLVFSRLGSVRVECRFRINREQSLLTHARAYPPSPSRRTFQEVVIRHFGPHPVLIYVDK